MARWVSAVYESFISHADQGTVYAPAIELYEKRVGKGIWVDFLPEALKSGQFRPAPPTKVIGHGVEDLQKAVDLMREGVSAQKLIVTL